jgi:hypothetical protein
MWDMECEEPQNVTVALASEPLGLELLELAVLLLAVCWIDPNISPYWRDFA